MCHLNFMWAHDCCRQGGGRGCVGPDAPRPRACRQTSLQQYLQYQARELEQQLSSPRGSFNLSTGPKSPPSPLLQQSPQVLPAYQPQRTNSSSHVQQVSSRRAHKHRAIVSDAACLSVAARMRARTTREHPRSSLPGRDDPKLTCDWDPSGDAPPRHPGPSTSAASPSSSAATTAQVQPVTATATAGHRGLSRAR